MPGGMPSDVYGATINLTCRGNFWDVDFQVSSIILLARIEINFHSKFCQLTIVKP